MSSSGTPPQIAMRCAQNSSLVVSGRGVPAFLCPEISVGIESREFVSDMKQQLAREVVVSIWSGPADSEGTQRDGLMD